MALFYDIFGYIFFNFQDNNSLAFGLGVPKSAAGLLLAMVRLVPVGALFSRLDELQMNSVDELAEKIIYNK